MQTKKADIDEGANSAFVSEINPKPDQGDKTISTSEYENRMRAYDAIERLAAVDHDQWQYWSMSIMRDLDEMIIAIIDLNKVLMNLDPDGYPTSKIHKRVEKLITKHNERNKRWESQWCAYKHLPEDVKETDRMWAKKEWEAIREK